MKLGISLYPEQETMEEITSYIKLASKYGFTRIFTSMFSVPGSKEEVSAYFKELCKVAHDNNMEVCADVNAGMFKKFDATEQDLSIFKEIGLDELRMDFCFGDERDAVLIQNKENIKIQFNASFVDVVKSALDKAKNVNLTLCHNFYPERYTGIPRKKYAEINKIWSVYDNIEVAGFISSNTQNAHGPWPVYDGLSTVEDHRGKSIDFQVRDMMAMGTDIIYFGNAFASEEELAEAHKAVMSLTVTTEETEFEKMIRSIMPDMGKKQMVLKVDSEIGLNDVEKEILFDFKKHCDLGDTSDYMIRSRVTRTIYGKKSIPHRRSEKAYFSKGDILIVNDNLKHYCGELQICMKDMANDGQRNLVGHLDEDEMKIVEMLEAGVYFMFKS